MREASRQELIDRAESALARAVHAEGRLETEMEICDALTFERDSHEQRANRAEATLGELLQVVEEEWPKLRVPPIVARNPPALVGTRLRRAAEKARSERP